MSGEFSSFESWSFSTRHRHKALLKQDESLATQGSDSDYTTLITALNDVLQDHLSLDLEFDDELSPSFEKSLGRGSSFIVRRVNQRDDISDRGQLVYKGSRAKEGRYSRTLSLAREALVLSHPMLKSHPNIVALKGIAWEQEDESETSLPVLVLEYAPLGDLSSFINENSVNVEVRAAFCSDVANGLHALHKLGMAHGDIKCENVLVFQCDSSSTGYVAKLSDFGFAEVCSVNGTKRLNKGTFPWNSPEWMDLIEVKNIPLTDIYSLGLLIWRCMLNGQNPFDGAPFTSFAASDRMQEIDVRKRNDQLLEDALSSVSHLEGISSNIKEALKYSLRADPSERDLKKVIWLLQSGSAELSLLSTPLITSAMNEFQELRRYLVLSLGEDRPLFSKYCLGGEFPAFSGILKEKVEGIRSEILDHLDRVELENVLDNFRVLMITEGSTPIRKEKKLPEMEQLVGQVCICFDRFHHVRPMTKNSIFAGLLFTSKHSSSEQRRTDALIHLSICYTLGFGTSPNTTLALHSLVEAASLGSIAAQALVKRMHDGLGQDAGKLPITKWLIAGAETGSIIALEDLKNWDLESHNAAVQKFKKTFCGLGVQIFDDETLDAVLNDKVDSFIKHKGDGIWRLNDRGDNIVHCVASCGSTRCLEYLIKRFPESLDTSNWIGETPLLFACRAGHYNNTIFLLQQNAKTTSCTSTGETPMHWLISFGEGDVRSVAMGLVESGGYFMVWSIAEANNSCFPHYYNGLGEGTPLHRAVERRHSPAVRVLLELQGSCTLQRGTLIHGTWRCSPLMLACAMHDPERIELLLASDPSRSRINWRSTRGSILAYSDLLSKLLDENSLENFLEDGFSHSYLYFALVPFDLHRRICLHGAEYPQRMTESIDLLLGRGAVTDLVSEDNLTGFFAAAQSGDINIVEKIVAVEGLKHLNTPCLDLRRSPLQQTIYDDNKNVFFKLLAVGAEVNGVLADGNTLLQTCALSLPIDNIFATELIKRGASTTYLKNGRTPFCIAVIHRRYELSKLLLRAGADVNEVNYLDQPITTLGVVLSIGQYSLHSPLRFLLNLPQEYGDIAFTVKGQVSALHFAAFTTANFDSNNVERVFSALLGKFGSAKHLEWQDEEGYYPLDFAVFNINLEAVRSLLRAGAKANHVQKTPTEIEIPHMQPLNLVQNSWLINIIRAERDQLGGFNEENEDKELTDQRGLHAEVTAEVESLEAASEFTPWSGANPLQNMAILTEVADVLRSYGAELFEDLVAEYKEAGIVEEGEESTRIVLAA